MLIFNKFNFNKLDFNKFNFNTLRVAAACLLLLSGCVAKNRSAQPAGEYREQILLEANNYDGLIDLYRSRLKKRENAAVRLKLATFYYLSRDSKSSLYYLQPLLKKPNEEIYLLHVKNMIALADYEGALKVADAMLLKYPKSAEGWNLRGIILADTGKLAEALPDIQRSRDLFLNEAIALNNLAMLAMLNGRYDEASRLLLPLYLKGKKDRQLIHNLVFALVQSGDQRSARDIVTTEKLAADPERLIAALSQVKTLKKETP